MPFLPVALYGLEVPCDSPIVEATPDFPATFRITMAAIDPCEEPVNLSGDRNSPPMATLRIIRDQSEGSDADSEEYVRNLLAESGSDDSDDESESETKNGGPSDLSKTKKARKAAAVKQLMESIADGQSDEEMDDATSGTKVNKKGKAKAAETINSEDDEDSDDNQEMEEFVICTLNPKKKYQQSLDITIRENERVYFKATGNYTVYLTGNYLIEDDLGLNRDYENDDSDDDDESYDLSPDADELLLDSDNESDELDDLENPRITEIESEDEKAPKLKEKNDKNSGKNKRSADQINEDNSLDSIMTKSTKANANEEAKLSKKQLKKLKKNNGDASAVKTDDPKTDDSKMTDKNERKVQFAKDLEQGPTGSTDKSKSDQQSNTKKPSLGIKTVDGVKIDDKKLGSGKSCKKGDKVSMRYIGKLVNGSVFDSNKKGTPFSFKLGTGEVIKGWDIGVTGMSAGGERRLTIPPNRGYGNKQLPGIPANSTLIFDIKMLEVK